MKWHDCKTDPPKKNGHYILQTTNQYEEDWVAALFYVEPQTHSHEQGHWFDDYEEYICYDDYAYKWAEVDLSEDGRMSRVVVDKLPSKPNECPFYFETECQISTHLECVFEKCGNKCPHLVDAKELMKWL